MTKKILGSLIVTLLFSVVASASTVATEDCGSVVLNNTSVGFPTPYLTGLPNPTLTCLGFTAPIGDTITQVDFVLFNGFGGAVGGTTSTVTFTYDITGFNLAQLTTTASGVGMSGNPTFSPHVGCAAGGMGPPNGIDCTDAGLNQPGFGSIMFQAFATWTAGSLQSNGNETISLYAFFTYSPSGPPVPEPASLFMIGGGLIGLALVARRKRA
jgi:PEP-CTERM motif